jgi:hypothetical protein
VVIEGPTDYASCYERALAIALEKTGHPFEAEPAALSYIPPDTDISTYLIGSKMLGFDITPQGCQVAGVMEAKGPDGLPLYDDVTVQLSRRSAKTTSIQCVLLGRSETLPRYRILQTAQDGTRASEVFMEMVEFLEAEQPPDTEPNWTVFRSTGREYLKWNNGAMWRVVAPKARSFRSKAANVVFVDENGEHDPEESEQIEAGALPTLDTKPDGQLVRAGTPGTARAGTFWSSLQKAGLEPDRLGVVDYHALEREVITEEQVSSPELWRKRHPGVASGLTTVRTIETRYKKMDTPKFVREYLCVWPPDNSNTAINQQEWANSRVPQLDTPDGLPWALGFDVAIGASASALAAGWFDADGHPHVQLLDHRAGAHWLPDELLKAQLKHPRIQVGYDNIGDNIAVAQAVTRKPRFSSRRLKALPLRDVAASTATMVGHLGQGTFTHGADPTLDAVILNAIWRESNSSRLFGRKHGKDISPLMACVQALAAASTARTGSRLEVPAAMTG